MGVLLERNRKYIDAIMEAIKNGDRDKLREIDDDLRDRVDIIAKMIDYKNRNKSNRLYLGAFKIQVNDWVKEAFKYSSEYESIKGASRIDIYPIWKYIGLILTRKKMDAEEKNRFLDRKIPFLLPRVSLLMSLDSRKYPVFGYTRPEIAVYPSGDVLGISYGEYMSLDRAGYHIKEDSPSLLVEFSPISVTLNWYDWADEFAKNIWLLAKDGSEFNVVLFGRDESIFSPGRFMILLESIDKSGNPKNVHSYYTTFSFPPGLALEVATRFLISPEYYGITRFEFEGQARLPYSLLIDKDENSPEDRKTIIPPPRGTGSKEIRVCINSEYVTSNDSLCEEIFEKMGRYASRKYGVEVFHDVRVILGRKM